MFDKIKLFFSNLLSSGIIMRALYFIIGFIGALIANSFPVFHDIFCNCLLKPE